MTVPSESSNMNETESGAVCPSFSQFPLAKTPLDGSSAKTSRQSLEQFGTRIDVRFSASAKQANMPSPCRTRESCEGGRSEFSSMCIQNVLIAVHVFPIT